MPDNSDGAAGLALLREDLADDSPVPAIEAGRPVEELDARHLIGTRIAAGLKSKRLRTPPTVEAASAPGGGAGSELRGDNAGGLVEAPPAV